MTRLEMDMAAVQRACCGNQEAMDFLKHWSAYVHAIDDIIDGDLKGSEGIIATFAKAIPPAHQSSAAATEHEPQRT